MSPTAGVAISITLVLIVLGFIYRRSQYVFCAQIVWMTIIIGLNTYAVDWKSNYPIFLLSESSVSLHQNLYENLCTVFKHLGFDFIGFNAVITLVAMCLIVIRIKASANNPAMMTSLMLIYPFVDFVVQKRFFPAFALVFWALPKASSSQKKDRVIFLIVVLLAGWIHSSLWFYLLFAFFWFIPEKIIHKSTFIFFIISVFSNSFVFWFMQRVPFVSSNKFKLYFITYAVKSSNIKYMFWIALHIANFLPIYFMYHWMKKKKKEDAKVKSICTQNIIMFFLIPFYSFDPVFMRVFRPLLITNYAVIAGGLDKGNKQKMILLLLNIYQVVLCLGTFIIMYILTTDFNAMVITIFENNAFLNIFK